MALSFVRYLAEQQIHSSRSHNPGSLRGVLWGLNGLPRPTGKISWQWQKNISLDNVHALPKAADQTATQKTGSARTFSSPRLPWTKCFTNCFALGPLDPSKIPACKSSTNTSLIAPFSRQGSRHYLNHHLYISGHPFKAAIASISTFICFSTDQIWAPPLVQGTLFIRRPQFHSRHPNLPAPFSRCWELWPQKLPFVVVPQFCHSW